MSKTSLVLVHLLSVFSLSSECLNTVFTFSFTSSLNFITYHCKPNKIKSSCTAAMIWVWTVSSSLLAVIHKQEKTGLIIDLRNFVRTDIQMTSPKWNHFALGILKTKPEENWEKIVSQMLNVSCSLRSLRSVYTPFLLKIGQVCRKLCWYLSYLTVTEVYLKALYLSLCNSGRNSCGWKLVLAITLKPFIFLYIEVYNLSFQTEPFCTLQVNNSAILQQA